MERKKSKRLAITMFVAAAATICLIACKKEFVTTIDNNDDTLIDAEYCQEARDVVGKINKFKTQVSDKDDVMRNSTYMPLDSVVWNIESLFNASYTFPERKYLETVKQELEFTVAVNDSQAVMLGDVADLYDDIIDAVRQAYASDGITSDKSLMAVVVEKGEVHGSTAGIIVHVISGRAKVHTASSMTGEGPFGPDDYWYFGEYGGTCSDPSVWGDAAEILEDSINYYWGGTSVPKSGFRYLSVNLTRISLEGNEFLDETGKPYLYFYSLYENPPLCLNGNMLNYYYYRELEVLLHIVPGESEYQSLMPPAPAFLQVDIVGLMSYVGNISCVQHKNYITYCSKWAIPLTALAPSVNLLD